MIEAIKNFPKQFEFDPIVENSEKLVSFQKFIVLGMGGSHLAADLLKMWNPNSDVLVHEDYGLPEICREDLEKSLIIASSYSGNTEEVLDGFTQALDSNFSSAVISIGGKLLKIAREKQIPFIQIPDTGIQPRMALGFNLKALFKLMKEEAPLEELEMLAKTLNPEKEESKGKALAEKLRGFIPVIYASRKNLPVAYNWKIKFNETGKIPAFYNVLPELNHNEMNGFDVQDSSRNLSEKFYFIFIRDSSDHRRVLRRMDVLEKMYKDRKLPVEVLDLEGRGQFEKIFSSLLLADWTAVHTAQNYGLEPEKVPMVEEFKKLIE